MHVNRFRHWTLLVLRDEAAAGRCELEEQTSVHEITEKAAAGRSPGDCIVTTEGQAPTAAREPASAKRVS